MYTKATILSALLAAAEARFGQEQVPVADIQALSNFGNPGQAATLAGSVPGVLLAAADPCDKLTLADEIVTTLGDDPQVIAAAQNLVGAEQNFNPFAVSIPNICGDASLPATEALRGIVPLVDPAVAGSDVENANSESSLQNPFDAAGLSVADVMKAQGFSNFTVNGASSGNAGSNAGSNQASATSSAAAAVTTSATKCKGSAHSTSTTATAAATSSAASSSDNEDDGAQTGNNGSATAAGAGAVEDAVTGNFPGFQASSLGLDFGTCTPTVKFEESLNGRKAGEFTFQAQDPVVNKGQQEALNPNIIFNRICDQLVNVCGAADDAVSACRTAQADLGGGAKDATTANAWNEALGFAGVDINPDDAPKAGLVGHT
ncbi:hypothetical protein F5X99DRAFT_158399 [Biscogniauxia marginata]|nr:hypothetical protein F5X99DRAFT_158399 [Biscogniauxia marginata]